MSLELGDTRFHHAIFTQGMGVRRGDTVLVKSHWNGNLKAYGELIPGTVVVLPEDDHLPTQVAVPLDARLRPVLVPGFTTRNLLLRSAAYARARSLIRRVVRRSDFVQIQHVSPLGFMAGTAAIAFGTPFYLDIGGSGSLRDSAEALDSSWRSRLAARYYRRVEKKLARSASLLIATNAHLHEIFPPSEAPRVVVSHSAVERTCIFKRDTACTGDHLQIFLATRVVKLKGIHYLMRAVKLLKDESWDVTLKIAGEGAYMATLRSLVAELGLESQVDFLGAIPGGSPELWQHYRQADIVVLPSIVNEGTPRMIIEAWAAGAPVIATNMTGINTLIEDRRHGLLVPPADAAALAAAIKRVYTDADLRTRLVANAYQRVDSLTYEARLPILRDVFARYLPGLLPESAE